MKRFPVFKMRTLWLRDITCLPSPAVRWLNSNRGSRIHFLKDHVASKAQAETCWRDCAWPIEHLATTEEFWGKSWVLTRRKRRVNERLEGSDYATRRNVQGAGCSAEKERSATETVAEGWRQLENYKWHEGGKRQRWRNLLKKVFGGMS